MYQPPGLVLPKGTYTQYLCMPDPLSCSYSYSCSFWQLYYRQAQFKRSQLSVNCIHNIALHACLYYELTCSLQLACLLAKYDFGEKEKNDNGRSKTNKKYWRKKIFINFEVLLCAGTRVRASSRVVVIIIYLYIQRSFVCALTSPATSWRCCVHAAADV